MSVHQKTAILLIRIAGLVMLMIAVMGLLHYGYRLAVGAVDASERARAEAGVLWFVFGLLLIGASRPLGGWLARDLD